RGLLQPMLLQALSDRTAGSDPQPPDRF
ncbi:MAG: hypothetical protein K0R44_239, partial [Thermomicrobiales bacterium]|nr:hypothetical protein [Thermomicrobiales bacterium]